MSKPANQKTQNRRRILTGDGSHTYELSPGGETYHSRHGALAESQHVFIEMGLRPFLKDQAVIRILEVGFGTGLNALLSFEAAAKEKVIVSYSSLEPFPFEMDELKGLNYVPENSALEQLFLRFHRAIDDQPTAIAPAFTFTRHRSTLEDFEALAASFDLVYYDAFGPNTQPELWTPACFEKVFRLLAVGGCMVTYCAKGQVRRDLKWLGFEVEQLPGPPGKREMLRATKIAAE